MDAIIYIVLIATLGLALVVAVLRVVALERRNADLKARLNAGETALAQMNGHFRLTAQEAVQKAHESFLQLAEARLKDAQKDGAHDLEKRHKAIDELVKPVHKNLEELNKTLEQVRGTDQALREDLKNLHKETSKLAGALRNPAARGNWGEEMLERLLENSGLIKGVQYQLQATLAGDERRLRPDAIVNLPDGLHIVIDSKAPINDFVRNLDRDLDESSYKDLQVGLASAVRSHIQQLSKKAYWEQLNSPDFMVLFLPSEHLFSAAIQADPTLLDLAAEKKIVMASPILTMSLLRVVGMSWRQLDVQKNAAEIAECGTELYNRLLTFTDHLARVGKNLQSAMSGYDAAVGSLEKSVIPAARKMNGLQGAGTAEIPAFEPVERPPRLLSLTDEDERRKKRA